MNRIAGLVFAAGLLSCASVVEPPPGCTVDENEAAEAVARLLSLKGIDWGEPDRVEFANLLFTLSYPTPQAELEQLGGRVATVDCISGTVRTSRDQDGG